MGQKVKQGTDLSRFRYVFILIRWFGITASERKAPKRQEVMKMTAYGSIHSLASIINYIYSKFQINPTCIRAVMGQKLKQDSDFVMYFYRTRMFDNTAFASKAPQLQEAVKITASVPRPVFCKYYKLHIQQISDDLACIRVLINNNV